MRFIEKGCTQFVDDWYGEIYLQTCVHETDAKVQTMTKRDEFEITVMVYFNDYSETICLAASSPSERDELNYIHNTPCGLCDGKDGLTASIFCWLDDEEWNRDSIKLCRRCRNRVFGIVDTEVFENEELYEHIVTNLI